ncbi:MAG TPA: MFS transporter [Caldilineaceae bacterium]|nr:MFS transporter [Caldilineaceae bacterium]
MQYGVSAQGALAPLRVPDFRRLLSSNALWWQAVFMENLVVGWLVLEMTDSAWLVALTGFCRSLPLLLCGYFAGPLADRFGRRRIIVSAQAANLTCYVATLGLLWSGQLAPWHLAAAAFGLGAAWAVDWPARRALLPDLIGKERTVDAMLMENFVQGCARIFGPLLAGTVVARFGATGCYVVMALLSGMALATVQTLSNQPIPRTNRRPEISPWSALGESLRYVGRSQPILGVMLVTIVMNLLLIPYMSLLPVFARDVLHQGPAGLGLLGAASGIGSFLGLLLTNRLRRTISNGWILAGGTFGASIALLVFSQSTIYGLSWASLLAAGMGQACFGIMQSSIILLTASDEMRSRTMGILVLAIGSDPLGKLQVGALASLMGAPRAVGVQAAMAACALVVITLLLPGLRARSGPPRPVTSGD